MGIGAREGGLFESIGINRFLFGVGRISGQQLQARRRFRCRDFDNLELDTVSFETHPPTVCLGPGGTDEPANYGRTPARSTSNSTIARSPNSFSALRCTRQRGLRRGYEDLT